MYSLKEIIEKLYKFKEDQYFINNIQFWLDRSPKLLALFYHNQPRNGKI